MPASTDDSALTKKGQLNDQLMDVVGELHTIQHILAVLDEYLIHEADEATDAAFFERKRACGRADISDHLLHRLEDVSDEIRRIHRELRTAGPRYKPEAVEIAENGGVDAFPSLNSDAGPDLE